MDSITPDQDGIFTLRTSSNLKEVVAMYQNTASINPYLQVPYLGLADLGKNPSVNLREDYIQVEIISLQLHPPKYSSLLACGLLSHFNVKENLLT